MEKTVLIHTILALLAFSCAGGHGRGIIPEELFVKVYADMLIVNNVEKMTKTDTAQNRMQIDSVFHSYSVSREQVNATIDYYNSHLERWKELLDKVNSRLDVLQAEQDRNSKK